MYIYECTENSKNVQCAVTEEGIESLQAGPCHITISEGQPVVQLLSDAPMLSSPRKVHAWLANTLCFVILHTPLPQFRFKEDLTENHSSYINK